MRGERGESAWEMRGVTLSLASVWCQAPLPLTTDWGMLPPHRLKVYSQALELARVCARECGRIPDVDLRRQLLRAVRSVPANLAEGAVSESQAVFARHIAIAVGSLHEAHCHLTMATDAALLPQGGRAAVEEHIDNLRPRLIRLLAAVRHQAKRRAG